LCWGVRSAALSRLGTLKLDGFDASVISNLVEGEILQMKEVDDGEVRVMGMRRRSGEEWG